MQFAEHNAPEERDFLCNAWYVAAWSTELPPGEVIGRQIIGEPIACFRSPDGRVHALEDRCPHRHAPLSLGRIEGEHLRCMYHGLKFSADGACVEVPGNDRIPPNSCARTYPCEERHGWIWVWPGDVEQADPSFIPAAYGLDPLRYSLMSSQLDYEANYQLINDNLCDLSHVDFVHERTLGVGAFGWADAQPKITTLDRSIRVERWLNGITDPADPQPCEYWNSYEFHIPGIFVMSSFLYPVGSAERFGGVAPNLLEAKGHRVEQQAVTPIDQKRTRYFFASGLEAVNVPEEIMSRFFDVIEAAFAEDRRMIEAQQRIWDLTSTDRRKMFIAHDKAPSIIRRLIARLIDKERATEMSTTRSPVRELSR
ncbi:MAG TPA: aromatic ring-hydroxylating dioxygenase subunit alpha [Sphingobium sp.]|nr:aromatic ring-hydroxylating dioxygenase subunit alpha [Sphingobium sp.]